MGGGLDGISFLDPQPLPQLQARMHNIAPQFGDPAPAPAPAPAAGPCQKLFRLDEQSANCGEMCLAPGEAADAAVEHGESTKCTEGTDCCKDQCYTKFVKEEEL